MNESELIILWRKMRPLIKKQIVRFRTLGRTCSDEDLFGELAFCLFTPQSRAFSCWSAVEALKKEKLLTTCGDTAVIARVIARKGVRFKNNKARYLIEARRFCIPGKGTLRWQLASFTTSFESREWLVKNVKGIGLKEASHFLRNTGHGDDLAILDRHILKNLVQLGVIKTVPANLSKSTYFDIENRMRVFSEKVKIPLGHLDFVLWYKETGAIFK
jgi:N-glycosylase/DNA lyase